MKTTFTKIALLMIAVSALSVASCKNPNATQETDGAQQPGPTAQEIDSSAVQNQEPGGATTKGEAPQDLEGDNNSNTQ